MYGSMTEDEEEDDGCVVGVDTRHESTSIAWVSCDGCVALVAPKIKKRTTDA